MSSVLDRKKLIQVIVYLAHNTRALGKTKLFKLLYLIDFEHFRQTGRSITGMEYRAWKMGPVPFALAQEWDGLERDIAAAVEIQPVRVFDHERDQVIPKIPFDSGKFSRRELGIMKDIAEQYRDALSGTMIDVTYAENGAWEKVWDKGMGNDRVIEHMLAIADDDLHREAILEAAAEYKAICAALDK